MNNLKIFSALFFFLAGGNFLIAQNKTGKGVPSVQTEPYHQQQLEWDEYEGIWKGSSRLEDKIYIDSLKVAEYIDSTDAKIDELSLGVNDLDTASELSWVKGGNTSNNDPNFLGLSDNDTLSIGVDGQPFIKIETPQKAVIPFGELVISRETSNQTRNLLTLQNTNGGAFDGAAIHFRVGNAQEGAGVQIKAQRTTQSFLYDLIFSTSSSSTAAPSEKMRLFNNGGLNLGTGAYTPQGGVLNVRNGFRVNNLAAEGNVLRGNGSNFVSSQISLADVGGAGVLTVTGNLSSDADSAAGVAGVQSGDIYYWTDSNGGTMVMVKN